MHPLFTFFGMLYDLLWGCFKSSSFQDHVPDETEHFVHKCVFGGQSTTHFGSDQWTLGMLFAAPAARTLHDIFGALAVLLGVSRPNKCGSNPWILYQNLEKWPTKNKDIMIYHDITIRKRPGSRISRQGSRDSTHFSLPYAKVHATNPVYFSATCHVPQHSFATTIALIHLRGSWQNELMVIF